MEGRLIGGCMDVLTLFLGTEFDGVKAFAEKYQKDGILWFLEACDLNPMGIRRAPVADGTGRLVPVCEGLPDRTAACTTGKCSSIWISMRLSPGSWENMGYRS